MKIEWWWNDGYVRNIPRQELEIDDEELEGMTDEERKGYIDDVVREAFQERVTYDWAQL